MENVEGYRVKLSSHKNCSVRKKKRHSIRFFPPLCYINGACDSSWMNNPSQSTLIYVTRPRTQRSLRRLSNTKQKTKNKFKNLKRKKKGKPQR